MQNLNACDNDHSLLVSALAYVNNMAFVSPPPNFRAQERVLYIF